MGTQALKMPGVGERAPELEPEAASTPSTPAPVRPSPSGVHDGSTPRRSWLGRRWQSFACAGRGVWLLRREPNARIHAAATLGVLLLAAALGLSALEWALVVLAIGLVLATEALNTALEHLANATMPERHPLVGAAKDLAAGGVLLAALAAAAIALLVFGPHLVALGSSWLAR